MSPSQLFSLAFLGGLLPGYLAGMWCPWWLAGLPCYAIAFIVYRVASTDPDNAPVEVTAAAHGALMGSCAAASVVGLLCNRAHEAAVVHGPDPCIAPLIVGIVYGVHVWRDDTNPPAFPAVRSEVAWLGLGLYAVSLALAALMRGGL